MPDHSGLTAGLDAARHSRPGLPWPQRSPTRHRSLFGIGPARDTAHTVPRQRSDIVLPRVASFGQPRPPRSRAPSKSWKRWLSCSSLPAAIGSAAMLASLASATPRILTGVHPDIGSRRHRALLSLRIVARTGSRTARVRRQMSSSSASGRNCRGRSFPFTSKRRSCWSARSSGLCS